jgi:hypothetical protein
MAAEMGHWGAAITKSVKYATLIVSETHLVETRIEAAMLSAPSLPPVGGGDATADPPQVLAQGVKGRDILVRKIYEEDSSAKEMRGLGKQKGGMKRVRSNSGQNVARVPSYKMMILICLLLVTQWLYIA